MKKYIVVDSRIDGNGDMFESVFDTLEEAVEEASRQWRYLTDRAKGKRKIEVGMVTEDDLQDDLASEDSAGWDGERDWLAYHSYSIIKEIAG